MLRMYVFFGLKSCSRIIKHNMGENPYKLTTIEITKPIINYKLLKIYIEHNMIYALYNGNRPNIVQSVILN